MRRKIVKRPTFFAILSIGYSIVPKFAESRLKSLETSPNWGSVSKTFFLARLTDYLWILETSQRVGG